LLQGAKNFLTGTWEWLKVALTEGPRGLWRMVVDRLTGLGQIVLESAVRWVMTRIVAIVGARLTALAASAGWSLVIEAVVVIYQAIRTAMEYAQRILQILLTAFNTVAQIAQGVIGPAATMIENGLRMILPIVVGFLANYAGLGGISNRIRDIIGGIRERVDAAILWLIDRGMATLQGLLNMIRRGVTAVAEWWRMRKQFRTKEGESHSLFFGGEGTSARLMIASSLQQDARNFLEKVHPKLTGDSKKLTAWNCAMNEYNTIERLTAALTGQAPRPQPAAHLTPAPQEIEQINTSMNNMSVQIAIIGFKEEELDYPDLPSPVTSASLKAIAESIPDITEKEKLELGKEQREPPNRAGGHIWIRLKKRTDKLSNFGATARVMSGSFRMGSAEMTTAVTQAIEGQATNLREAGMRIADGPYEARGAFPEGVVRTADTEAYVMAIARKLKLANERTINRVDVRVYTIKEPCRHCQAKAHLNAIGAYPSLYEFSTPPVLKDVPTIGDVEFYDSEGNIFHVEWNAKEGKGRAKKKSLLRILFGVVSGVGLLGTLAVGGYWGVKFVVAHFGVMDPQAVMIIAITSVLALLCATIFNRGLARIGQKELNAHSHIEKAHLYERVMLIWGAKLKSRATSVDPSFEDELQQLAQLLTLRGSPRVIKAYVELHALERIVGLHSPDIPARVAAVLMEMRQDLGSETRGLTADELRHLFLTDADQASTPAPAPTYQDLQPRVSLAASS
jgi:hypothetical protein